MATSSKTQSALLQSTTSLATFLQADIACSERLLDILQKEREFLIQREQRQLTALLEVKSALLVELDNQAAQRLAYLQTLGLPPTEQAWRQSLTASEDPHIQDLWQILQALLTDCKHHNEVNGKMISRSRMTLGRLLNLLRGQPETGELYNKKGEHQGSAGAATTLRV